MKLNSFFTHLLIMVALLLSTGCSNYFTKDEDSEQNATTLGATEETSKNEVSTTVAQPLGARVRFTPRRPMATAPTPQPTYEPFQGVPNFYQPQPINIQSETTTCVVQKGDTLWKIARQHGVKLSELLALNQLTNRSVLLPGQILKIPHGAHQNTKDTFLAKKPSVSKKITSEPSYSAWSGGNEYTVQKGDTLDKISRKTGTNLQKLIDINQVSDPRTLRIGQKLRLSGENVEPISKIDTAHETLTTTPPVPATTETQELVPTVENLDQEDNVPHNQIITDEDVENLFEDTNAIPVVPIDDL